MYVYFYEGPERMAVSRRWCPRLDDLLPVAALLVEFPLFPRLDRDGLGAWEFGGGEYETFGEEPGRGKEPDEAVAAYLLMKAERSER